MFDNTFQAILISAFVLFAIAGVAIFATNPNILSGGPSEPAVSANFQMWGTVEEDVINTILTQSGIEEDDNITVTYDFVPENELETRLINALARGEGPDTLLFSHSQLLQLREFLTNIGAQTYPVRAFQNQFVEGAEIFIDSQGVKAIPFAMDPLVTYWNRDILTAAGYTNPPQTWEQTTNYAQAVTQISDNRDILQSALALGTPDSVTQSKAILSALFLQAGNDIVEQTAGSLTAVLADGSGANSALNLYTQFANPQANVYSWNNSFGQDRRAFAAGDTALYFDKASRIQDVRDLNPNLNFDVAEFIQRADAPPRTFADFYGIGIVNQAANKGQIFSVLQQLTNAENGALLATQTNYTPVQKSVISAGIPSDPYKSVFLDSAVYARGWLDPAPEQTSMTFADSIQAVISNELSTGNAIDRLGRSVSQLLTTYE